MHYDDEGNVTGKSVTVREPEWDGTSRGWAVAMQEWDARRCPGCGDDITETTKDEHEGAYRAQLPVRCHRCHSLYDATDIIHGNDSEGSPKYPQPRALSIPIVLRK